jgi:hypothetical protein
VAGNESLERISAQGAGSRARAREDRIIRTATTLGEPGRQDLYEVATKRRATHLASLARTADVSPDAKVYIAASEGPDLGVSESRLCRQEKHGAVSPADPRFEVGSRDECRGFFVC